MLLYGSLFVASVHLLCPSICRLAVGVYVGQPLGEGPSSTKKRHKNKKKSNKKLRSDTQ
jgi:hypothetical protein